MTSTFPNPGQLIDLGHETFSKLLRASGVPLGSTVRMTPSGPKQVADWSRRSSRKLTKPKAAAASKTAAKFTPQDYTVGSHVACVAAGIKFRSNAVTFPSS